MWNLYIYSIELFQNEDLLKGGRKKHEKLTVYANGQSAEFWKQNSDSLHRNTYYC